MKQKYKKIVFWKIIIAIFIAVFTLLVKTFAQYYYFDDGWKTYQQWCDETLDVKVMNLEWRNINWWSFDLVLDPSTTTYPHTDDVSSLRSFFVASKIFFTKGWAADNSPYWEENSDYKILKIALTNGEGTNNATSWSYWTIKFKPVFSGGNYNVVFWMQYIPWDSTTETTLSAPGWFELINAEEQVSQMTWIFLVLQEPCVADTNKPTISGLPITNGSTKFSYLSWLSFRLKDDAWVTWLWNVPYIYNEWGLWTGNEWGVISNQYWIDQSEFSLVLSWNWKNVTITNTTPWFIIKTWSWKTWQNNWLNANITIESWALFDFWIEKKITATFTFKDRAGNTSGLTINFNMPQGPTLISNSTSPANGDIYVNLSEPIKLWIKDEWAGVDSGTVQITVKGINWTSYWPYVFSGSDLNLSWVQWSANKPDYYLSISNHEKFPTSGTIQISVYAKDVEWKENSIWDYSFKTRPDCSEFQCCDPVLVDLWNTGATYYYNTWLIISGWNNPTFSVDEENYTWIIDCNAENGWLSVYSWLDSFVFFTDEQELTILWTWIKWVLSWDVLILSYMVESSQIVIDKPTDSEALSSWDVDIQWHLTWVENEEDWLSWYIVEILWDNFETWWFIDGTWIIETLPDWEYTISIYPVDLWWHTGNQTEITFTVDTTWPDFEFINRSGYECETWYLEITGVSDNLSVIHLLPYSFDRIDWTWNNIVIINSQNRTWFASKTWYVRDSLENVSEKWATYEFIDTWIFVSIDNFDLWMLVPNYTTWVVDLFNTLGASEWSCGIDKLWLDIISCEKSTWSIDWWNLVINPDPYYEGTWLCVLRINDDDWNTKDISLSFKIDTKASSCALSPHTSQCTSWEIILSLQALDYVSWYNWDGSNTWIPWVSWITIWVNELWVYTWYVIDGNWNISGCSISISTDILDKTPISATIIQATWYECQTITWYIQVSTWDTCGKNSLDKFMYSWSGATYLSISWNGIYLAESWIQNISVSVQDLVGNTENLIVPYIWYDSPIQFSGIEIASIWNNVTGFNWKNEANVSDWDCGSSTIEFGWFIDSWTNWTCTTWEWDIILYTPNLEIQYEWDDICEFEISDDEWNTWLVTISFEWVDTKKPECSISYNENLCTSWSVVLNMNITWAVQYSWTWFDSMVSNNNTYSIDRNWIVTGYVEDSAWNTWYCTWYVQTFDNVAPTISIPEAINLTWEECTLIEWNIEVIDNWWCWEGFNYSWDWFGSWNDEYYSWYSELVTWKKATVFVQDSAWNTASKVLNYHWTDTWVQLINWNEQIITNVLLTWWNAYNTTTWELISLFGAREWNCWPKYISVEKISCDWLSMDIDWEWSVVVTWNDNLSETWSCILRFSDNDWNFVTWVLKIKVDTVAPWVELLWTNVACMSTNIFDVTWIFTESVQWFELWDIFVQNWNVSSFSWSYWEYTWQVIIDPMVEVRVSIPAWVAADLAWNENTQSINNLTWMYDNEWPNSVTLVEKTTVYSENANFARWQATDNWCAWVSGYQRELYLWECGWPQLISWWNTQFNTENFDINWLQDTETYCWRVMPVDNFWNTWSWVQNSFDVDLSAIWCEFEYDATCTSWVLQVKLVPATGYTANWDIYLSWQDTWDWRNVDYLQTWVNFSGDVLTWYIYQPNTAKFSSCEFVASTIDTENPEVVSVNVEAKPECTTWIAIISEISDEWCGQWIYTYNWNWEWYWDSISFSQYFGQSGTKNVDLKVKDNVWNESEMVWVLFTWTDTYITADSFFTWSENVWNTWKTVNWRTKSNATDWDCGNWELNVIFSWFISTWTKWICTTGDGDNITYVPNFGMTWDDVCELQLRDDEWNTVNINSYWYWIDTVLPTCDISYEPKSCVSWSVLLTVTASEAIKQITWWDLLWWISWNFATWNVVSNETYNIEIKDFAGNTWSCNVTINNINTGVLDKPEISNPINWSYTNDNTLDVSWSSVTGNWCRYVSWYQIQIWSWWEVWTGWFTKLKIWTTPELGDWDYIIKVSTIDILWWESQPDEIAVTVDTKEPTCTIQYSEACTSGNVQLSMMAPEANYYSWTGFSDLTITTGLNIVNSNWIYYCYVQDFAGNTWMNSIELSNIKTWVLLKPNNLSIVGWTPTNDTTPEFVWLSGSNDWCREVSWYQVQILSWWEPIFDEVIYETGFVYSDILWNWEYVIKVRTHDTLWWDSDWTGLSFVVDTVAPICSIDVVTEVCTNSGVQIKLSWDSSDIYSYEWWNWTTWNFSNSIITIINTNWEYTWYVYDLAWNQWLCTWIVWLDILDNNLISFELHGDNWYECEEITWYVQVATWDSCGKDSLDKFTYLRDWWFTGNKYWITIGDMSWFNVDILISDEAWNIASGSVSYSWQDTGVTLISGDNQDIWVITWEYSITTWDLINLFDAEEWLCGKAQVTVTWANCSWANYTLNDWIFTIVPDNNLDYVDGYCTFEFGDNEWNYTVIWTLNFVIDNVVPDLDLTWNAICAKWWIAWTVTWIWSEVVVWFEIWDITAINGIVWTSFWYSSNPIFRWTVTSPTVWVWITTLTIPVGAVIDNAWNGNLQEKSLSWEYDNVWPNNVIFTNWQDVVFTTQTTLNWDAVSDSGCATWLSWYNFKFANWNSCDENIIIDSFDNVLSLDVSDLVHDNTYVLCVQPVDILWNTWNWTQRSFDVDLESIWCVIEQSPACSNTWITLTLKPWDWVEWWIISLSWTWFEDENMVNDSLLTRWVDQIWLLFTWYIRQVSWDIVKTSSCTWIVTNIDVIQPVFTEINIASWYECELITWGVVMVDEWCGSGLLSYSWDWLELSSNTEYWIPNNLWNTGRVVYVTWYDEVWNYTSTWVMFQWINSPITAHGFTWSEDVWNSEKTINWKDLSQASDWVCGSGTVYFYDIVVNWDKGTCTWEWDSITYTPILDQTWSDRCIIRLIDDESDYKDIRVSWSWIDTEKPSCILSVVDSLQCTSWPVILEITSESDDVATYSFDWINFWSTTTSGVDSLWVYTWYVEDNAWNIWVCTWIVNTWVLDLDDPILLVSNKTWHECSTISITVTWSDNSCGVNWLVYSWSWFDETWNTNEIYEWNVWTRRVDVWLYDWVWHYVSDYVVYTWENVPVTWHSFVVENVWTWVTVDWFESWNVLAWSCEMDDIIATTNDDELCEITWHNIRYTPSEWIDWWESCTILVTDWDMGEWSWIEITITFTWVDTKGPIVELQWWIWEQCTNENTFTVTWIFSEEVIGVTLNTLTWENVEINSFTKIDGSRYEWEVEMLWWTWKVWINSWEVEDLLWNQNESSDYLILWNYDNQWPGEIYLVRPANWEPSYSNLIMFEWSGLEDEWCANWVNYILEICADSLCDTVIRAWNVLGTWKEEWSLSNWTWYWRVIGRDAYGNTWVSEIRSFYINSDNPNCTISEEMLCSTWNVQLILTWDKNIEIENSWWVDWNWMWMLYTWEIWVTWEVVVIVRDSAGHTWQCDVSVTQHDEEWPEIIEQTWSVNECESITIQIVANDTWCAWISGYIFWLEFGLWWQISSDLSITAGQVWRTWWELVWKDQIVTVEDMLWNSTTTTWYRLNIVDVEPTLTTGTYEYWLITGNIVWLDIINILWASEWACGTWDLQVELWWCTNGTWTVEWGILSIEPEGDIEKNWWCELYISDNEWSTVTWFVSYYVDTKAPSCAIEYNPEELTNGDVTATLVCSGIQWTDWFVTNNLWDNEHTFDNTWTFVFEYADENWNTWTTGAVVYWIDKDKPVCTWLIYNPIWWTNENVLVRIDTWSCSENVIMLTDFEKEFTDNWDFVFKYRDAAWNTWELLAEVWEWKTSWIDRQAPECTVEYDSWWTNWSVALHMNVIGEAEHYWWNNENISWSNYDISVGINWLYTWYVADSVGNTWYCTWLVENIDEDNPSISLIATNISECTNNSVMLFTWLFSEQVNWFTSSNISVVSWIVSNFEVISWSEYSWTVIMSGWETNVFVPTGVVFDRAWNWNNISNIVTSIYDWQWPSNINMIRPNFDSWVNYWSTLILEWYEVDDDWCAQMSWYNYRVCEDYECNNIVSEWALTWTYVEIESLTWGDTYYWFVVAEDNFGNVWQYSSWKVLIDLSAIWCRFEELPLCTQTWVTVSLSIDGTWTHLSWTWEGYWIETWILYMYDIDQPLLHITWYVKDEVTGRTWECSWTIQNIDNTVPEIEILIATWYECEEITWYVQVSTWDSCGKDSLSKFSYNWSWWDGTNYQYSLSSNISTWYSVSLVVEDFVWNSVETGVQFEWINSPITAHGFTWSEDVWNSEKTINWKDLSQASDWVCGSGTVYFYDIVVNWDKGTCTWEWDSITYTPILDQTWSDRCIIRLIDDESDYKDIRVSWSWIDTEKPSCILSVVDSLQCTSWPVILEITSESDDVATYSFDWINFWSTTTSGVDSLWVYTWYVEDNAWNIWVCTWIVNTWVLDLDDPILLVSNKTWHECSTISITVTWSDNSCGVNWLVYSWSWFDETWNTNEIYEWNVWTRRVDVWLYDWVWHYVSDYVVYTWENVPVTWHSFVVENVWTWVTVDWFESWNVLAWSCEMDDIIATTNDDELCEITWHNIRYTPSEWIDWWESCTILVTDWDMGEWSWIEITITFTWVDTKGPIVELQWWIWEQCTNENTFTVTWIFSEEVIGVTLNTLTWENVEINSFTKIDGSRYEWEVEMLWWTWKVWINSWEVEDLLWNQNESSDYLILWNYDNQWPSAVSWEIPWLWYTFTGRTVYFQWSESNDEWWCAWFSWYLLKICRDSICDNIENSYQTSDTWYEVIFSQNWDYYWTVVSQDLYWNQTTWEIRWFSINSQDPSCSISQSECSTWSVTLTLTWDRDINIISWNINWYQVSPTNYTGEISENTWVWAIIQDNDELTGYCYFEVSGYDNQWPIFTFGNNSWNECEPWILSIIDEYDEWCAWITWDAYKFGIWEWWSSKIYSIDAQQIWSVTITWYVKDSLWIEAGKVATYTFNDVAPTISGNGVVDWVYTWELVIDVFDLLWVTEWSCWTWDLEVSVLNCVNITGYLDEHILTMNVNADVEWAWSCIVKIEDNEWSYVTWKVEFTVDTKSPECAWWFSVPAGWTSWDSVMVYLTGCSENIYGDTGHLFTWNTSYFFEFSDSLGNTWSLNVEYTWFDRETPVFHIYANPVYECYTWFVVISWAVDTGIWLLSNPYSFDWINRSSLNSKPIYSSVATWIFVSWYVKDWLGNWSSSWTVLTFMNSQPISATWFTVSGTLNWIDIDWKLVTNASDWACGSWTLVAEVVWWSIWTCTISWNILSYKPYNDYVTWGDNCELIIHDDEWSTITGINIEFTDINKYPYVELVSPVNGDIVTTWEITFSWSGVWNSSVISWYVYTIWNNLHVPVVVRQTWVDISIDNLEDGTYNWNVYAIFVDGTTWWLSSTYSFNLAKKVTWWGGWWGWVRLIKDKCPNWDESDSYYDWTCEANGWSHGSAIVDICGVNKSTYSDEQKWAYLYSYIYWITTVCPIQDANINWYLIRSHFAKMISEFAVNVLGFKPEKWKEWCDKFNDISNLNAELRNFVTVSCELWLMWLEADWETPAKSFNPGNYVTRAQFGTVLSRLLFGDMYNVKDEENAYKTVGFWYLNHLSALKNYWIMTKIDWDWPAYLERRWWVMIMLQRSDNYWIFAWKVPAKNWVSALFEK